MNDSWQPIAGVGNWSNATKLLNDTLGISIGYKFYANDSANNWNSTEVMSLISTLRSYTIGTAIVTCSDKIYISGGWANTYTLVNKTNSTCIEQISDNTYGLKVPIQVNVGGTYYLNGSDVKWLRLEVTNGMAYNNVTNIYNKGTTEINGVTIYSWNMNTSTYSGDGVRGYIYTDGNGSLNIRNSNLSYLGWSQNTQYFGVAWMTTHDFVADNNTFFKIYSLSAFQSYNGNFTNNIINDTGEKAIWTETSSTYNILIHNNSFNNCGGGGATAATGAYNITFTNNTIGGNGTCNIQIVTNSHDNIVRYNTITHISQSQGGTGSPHGAIDIQDGSYSNLIENNTVHDLESDGGTNPHGVYLHNNAGYGNIIRNNNISRMGGNGIEISVMNDNDIYNNIIDNTSVGVDIQDGLNNTISNNTITNSRSYDIYIEGVSVTGCGNQCYSYNNTFINNTGGLFWFQSIAGYTNTTIRDTKNDYNQLQYYFSNNPKDTVFIEYTYSSVFSLSSGNTTTHYPTKSSATLVNLTGTITSYVYPMTARPSSGYLNITVNKINESQDVWNITVSSSVPENPTTFTLQTANPNTNYVIKRDGVNYGTAKSDSTGLLNYTYSDTGTDWATSHRFEFVQGITPTGSITGIVTNGTSLIQGAIVSVNSYSNTTNSTGNYKITLPVGNYTVTASAGGYQSQAKNATVLENQTTVVNFNLTVAITTTTSTTTTSTTTSSTTTLTTSTTTTSSTTSTSTTTTSSTKSTTSTTTASTTSTSATTTSTTAASTSTTTSVTSTSVTSSTTTLPLCSVKGDLPPCDGLVDDWELLDYINKWAKGLVLDFDLLSAIKNWAIV